MNLDDFAPIPYPPLPVSSKPFTLPTAPATDSIPGTQPGSPNLEMGSMLGLPPAPGMVPPAAGTLGPPPQGMGMQPPGMPPAPGGGGPQNDDDLARFIAQGIRR